MYSSSQVTTAATAAQAMGKVTSTAMEIYQHKQKIVQTTTTKKVKL
jgi:hypothetical protein